MYTYEIIALSVHWGAELVVFGWTIQVRKFGIDLVQHA